MDIEQDLDSMAYVEQINNGLRVVPTIVFPDGDILIEPSNVDLANKLEIATKAERTFYDVVIIGGGSAGLKAAIYTSREGLETLVIQKGALGGQVGITQVIENFPGFDEGVFAAGDVRAGATAQAASAASEGAIVALMIRQYLQSIAEM